MTALTREAVGAVVFDVLGTMVDERSGLLSGFAEAVPGADDTFLAELLALWEGHVAATQRRIERGERPYATTEVVDAEAAHLVAERAGLTDERTIAHLATAGQRLPPWPDSVAGLGRLPAHLPVLGLSNAGHRALLRVNAHAGLRWHQSLSSESVGAYKPAPEVYRLAVDTVGCPPERLLMVAAHAWDLRGAQAVGMLTAYVRRPAGDPPTGADAFDGHFDSLDGLAEALAAIPW